MHPPCFFGSHPHTGLINARSLKGHPRARGRFDGSHRITGELHKLRYRTEKEPRLKKSATCRGRRDLALYYTEDFLPKVQRFWATGWHTPSRAVSSYALINSRTFSANSLRLRSLVFVSRRLAIASATNSSSDITVASN
jgi:hypothetical protein